VDSLAGKKLGTGKRSSLFPLCITDKKLFFH
jgi:hypothetical protein